MEIYLNRIDGIDDAIVSMYLSKRTLTRELELNIRRKVAMQSCFHFDGEFPLGGLQNMDDELVDWMTKLCRIAAKHITLLRFMDLSFTVYGLHRGGQDV